MKKDTHIQQSKFSPENKAISSLRLGLISVSLLIIGVFMNSGFGEVIPITEFHSRILSMILCLASPLIALLGLIFGIKGLKSSKKKFAIIGIGLCGIVLLWTIWLLGELYVISQGF